MKAYYDERPSVLEAVGNGDYLYRFDIAETDAPPAAIGAEGREQPTPRKQWECSEVTVRPPLTANRVTEAVIAASFPQSRELKLINDFNGIQFNMSADEADASRKALRYREWLEERGRLKAAVDADCARLGIK